jgi:hypothetical protein
MSLGLRKPQSCWWLLRLSNVSTIMREWIALRHAHLVPFVDTLLSGGRAGMHACIHTRVHARARTG